MAEDNKSDQKKLAQSVFEFMQEIGLNENEKTHMVEFKQQRLLKDTEF